MMPEYDIVYTCTQVHMNQCNEGLVMSEERNMVNLTLTVTREERKALKQLALDNETTVSALLRQWLKEHLEKEKVSTEHVIVQQGLNTSVNIALVDAGGERKFLMDPHSSQRKLDLEDVLPMLDETAPIVSFASIFISPCFSIEKMEKLFSGIKAAGKILVSDVTRPKNGETFEDLKVLFPYMDVFVPNDEEIFLLTGEKDPYRNVQMLVDAGVKTAVVKIGKDGSLVGTRDGITHVHAVPGVKCVDTTGAGDAFAAGFISGLIEGRSMTDCARIGCAAASCSIEQVGATDGVRSTDQVMERCMRIL